MSVENSGWFHLIPAPTSALPWTASDALEKLLRDFTFDTVLDVGSGKGDHATYLRTHGKQVFTYDLQGNYAGIGPEPDFCGEFEDVAFGRQFDALWISHILEHVLNVQAFLLKVFSLIKDNGILAITVPPLKHDIVTGHINLFNSGILLYRLICAGFDCSAASVKTYGYNISVIVHKKAIDIPISAHPYKLPQLIKFFPMPITENFDGRVPFEVNW